MSATRGKSVAIISGIVLAVLIIVGGISFKGQIQKWLQPRDTGSQQGFQGQTVFISEGTIPVVDFLKFLSDFTGRPVLFDSSDPKIANRSIQIAADIENANDEMVKAILETNGIKVLEKKLPDGKVVLEVQCRN